MDNFDAHKWFKKEYLGEGHTEDKTERDQFIRRYDQLSDDDKLKLAKIQAMMDRERSLREDDLDEISFGAAGTDKRSGQVISEIIQMIRNTGIDPSDVMEEIGQEFGVNFEFGRG